MERMDRSMKTEARSLIRMKSFFSSMAVALITAGGMTILALLLSIITTSAAPASTIENGKIAFVTERDGNYEIYSMNPDGSSQINLSNYWSMELDPVWSPDGSRIMFTSQRDGNLEIYVMNADGSDQTRLTNTEANESELDWSQDRSENRVQIGSGR